MKPRLGAKINFRHPLARGLVGCWLMNEGGGSKAFDLSRGKNHGSITGAISRIGNALQFPGASEITLPRIPRDTFPLTLVARFRTTSSANQAVVNFIGGSGLTYFGIGINGLAPYSYTRGGGSGVNTTGAAVANNQWVNVAGIFVDSTTRSLQVGNVVYTGPTGSANPSSLNLAEIGAFNASTYFVGQMEYAMVFDRALSQKEVQLLFSNPYDIIVSSTEDDLGFVLGGLNLTLVVSDSFGLADAPSKSDAKSISDSVNVLDARKLAFLKSVADNFTLSDSSNRVLVIVLQLADAFSLSSSEKRAVTKTVTELLALNDLSMKLAGKPFADSFGTGDAFTKRFTKGLQELFTLNDLMVKSTGKSLLDTLTLADLVGIVGGSGRPGLIHGMLSVDWEPRLMSLEWEGRNLTVHWTN